MGSIDSSLNALNSSLTDMTKQIQNRDAANVQTFTAYVQGQVNDKDSDAKYIEDLRPNQDRLNVFSTMINGDNIDYYKFNLKTGGKVNFSLLVNRLDDHGKVMDGDYSDALDIQIMEMHGNRPVVIADSRSSTGDNYDNYLSLQSDGLALRGGKYMIKVNRDASADSSANFFYSFQLSSGRFYQDFDTIQTPATKTVGTSILKYLQMSPSVVLMAASIDSTSAAVAQASTSAGASLSSSGDGTDPAVTFLSYFA